MSATFDALDRLTPAVVRETDENVEDLMLTPDDRNPHSGRKAELACRPPAGDLASFAVGGTCGCALGSAGFPALLDGVRGELPVGVAMGGGGEGLLTGEVSQSQDMGSLQLGLEDIHHRRCQSRNP